MASPEPWGRPILVVEDDPIVGELLLLRLNTAGYRPHWVRNGQAALGRALEVRPRLVVLDLGLPGMDGFEVLAALKGARRIWPLPVIVLTARQNAADVTRAISLGAVDYVAKPFNGEALMARIERRLSPPAPAIESVACPPPDAQAEYWID